MFYSSQPKTHKDSVFKPASSYQLLIMVPILLLFFPILDEEVLK